MQLFLVVKGHGVYVMVLLSSTLALCYNLVHSLMILHSSAVATTVIREAKIIGLLFVSYFVLGAPTP